MDGSDFDGRVFERGDQEYEAARRATCWNDRTPERYPDLVVQAAGEEDVVRAVRLARRARHEGRGPLGRAQLGGQPRSRRRAAARPLRRSARPRSTPRRARRPCSPGSRGNELAEVLAEDDLFFPAGHCPGVGVGGYLLQGGYGWNGRVHGPACMSVEAIDVVTADGELVRADAEQNSDLLWAARGSGPGFFGVVTRFHIRVYPRPKVVANGVHLYPIELLEEVFSWAHEIGPRIAADDGDDARHPPRRDGRARGRRHRPGARRHDRAGARGARPARDLPGDRPRQGLGPVRRGEARRPLRRRPRLLPGRASLLRRQHVDARAGRGAAPRSAPDRRDDAAARPRTCSG